MPSRLSVLGLVLFGVAAFVLGQAQDEDVKERSYLLSRVLAPDGDVMKDTAISPKALGREELVIYLTDAELSDLLSRLEQGEGTALGRVKRGARGRFRDLVYRPHRDRVRVINPVYRYRTSRRRQRYRTV